MRLAYGGARLFKHCRARLRQHPTIAMATQTTIAIPKSVFRRVVKDEIGPDKLVTQEALTLLQLESEKFKVSQFKWATEVASAHSRVTLRAEDMQVVSNADFRVVPGAKTILSYSEADDADLLCHGEAAPSEVVAHEIQGF